MDKKELQVIADLMEELKDQMEYGEDDFAERLGRKKPQVEVVKMEGSLPMDDEDMEHAEEMSGEDLDNDMEMGEDPEHAAMVLDRGEDDMEMMSPEEKLKQRLMKLRG